LFISPATRMHLSANSFEDDRNYSSIFNFKTGLWAEIIEEKKPLYVNQYGTEFFNDSDYCYFLKSDLKIEHSIKFGRNCAAPEECDIMSEVMTEQECYKWIGENWDKFNK